MPGPGHVQRTIIGRLTYKSFESTLGLVRDVYGLYGEQAVPPTQAQLKSVHRALRSLRAKGLIEQTDQWDHWGHRLWVFKGKTLMRGTINVKKRTQKPHLVESDHA